MRCWYLVPALFAFAASAPSAQPEQQSELWAGHQVLTGSRSVPVIGELETRSDSYVLAEVQRRGDTIELRQRPCSFSFREVLGVAVQMSPQTVARLPATDIRFEEQADGTLRASPWVVAWEAEDIDGDGAPGATVQVRSALCSGSIAVASNTRSTARGRLTEDGLAGEVTVRTRERVLETSSLCLKAGSKDRDETQHGRFRYRRVAQGTTCSSLARAPWPVRADDPPRKTGADDGR